MYNKPGILVVSFGTSHQDTRARTITAIEQAIQDAHPSLPVFRAWTSGMIRRKLERTTGEVIQSVAQALSQMADHGITQAILQPTHIIDGIENQQMQADANAFRNIFQKIAFGRPLLSSSEDLEKMAQILEHTFSGLGPEEHLILMGHGSQHPSNQIYARLDDCFHQQEHNPIHVATVEASPTLDDVLQNLRTQPVRRIHLAPLMIVAGDHAGQRHGRGWRRFLEIHFGAGRISCHLPPEGAGRISSSTADVPCPFGKSSGMPEKMTKKDIRKSLPNVFLFVPYLSFRLRIHNTVMIPMI